MIKQITFSFFFIKESFFFSLFLIVPNKKCGLNNAEKNEIDDTIGT